MTMLRKLWRYLTGPSFDAATEAVRITNAQQRHGLTVQTNGDGTCQREYDEAA